MSPDEKQFFLALGERIAAHRKALRLTQQQLAEQLGIAQQTLAHYEGARLRVPASMLPSLAELLTVSIESLIGQDATRSKRKREPPPKLAHHMERISRLPKPQQRLVLQVIESVLAQASRQGAST